MNGDRGQVVCAGQLAAHTFTHALCACGDLSFRLGLQTGSFDSSAADKNPVSAGAPVGIRGSYPPVGSQIGGSLTVAGTVPSAMPVSGPVTVEGDLRLAGSLTFGPFLTVRRDAWLVSRVWYLQAAIIERNLNYAVLGGTLLGVGPRSVGGAETLRSFTVEDPCGCDERLNIAEMERAGTANTDNAARGIPTTLLNNVTVAVVRTLDCGRFQFESIGGSAPIHLTITGRTAIFVDGDVTASDSFELTLAPGPNVEVDWFIRGNLSIGARQDRRPHASECDADLRRRNPRYPALEPSIFANIYAADTNVTLSSGALIGSVYGKNLSMPSGAHVIYDRAILNQGNQCAQPATCDKYNRYCNGGTVCRNNSCDVCGDRRRLRHAARLRPEPSPLSAASYLSLARTKKRSRGSSSRDATCLTPCTC